MVTLEKRRLVIMLAAFGKDEIAIAAALGITAPTLRKHYFRELKVKADARARVEATLLASLMAKIEGGDTAAMTLMWKRFDRHDMLQAPVRRRSSQPVGKKEQAKVDAKKVPSTWEGLVN